MNTARIAIVGMGSISALGSDRYTILDSYKHSKSKIRVLDSNHLGAPLQEMQEQELSELIREDARFEELDRTVCLALFAARAAVREAKWRAESGLGVNIGSSRGATDLLEKSISQFVQDPMRPLPARTSPTTTLGNISSWVAQDTGADLSISHSATCSTSAGSILNGVAWLKSGMCQHFLAGGSEAPLTAFTQAQMNALRITASLSHEFPCRPIAESADNTMVLGEGASVFALQPSEGLSLQPLALIDGLGWGLEPLSSASSISEGGEAFYRAMKMALDQGSGFRPDVVVLHAPGTRKGDQAEIAAIKRLFGEESPYLISNKWLIGHTLGASAGFSLELAVLLLNNDMIYEFPYPIYCQGKKPSRVQSVMINSGGFGGQAVSIVVNSAR